MRKNLKFEHALKKLEEIVGLLEKDDIDLEKSLKLFEEGISMSRVCTNHLNEAEKKIEMLLKDEEGNISLEPYVG